MGSRKKRSEVGDQRSGKQNTEFRSHDQRRMKGFEIGNQDFGLSF
jgi:hypothetical protein